MATDSQPFIVRFYDPAIKAKDVDGRTVNEILRFSNSELESYHDFIQYLFPLPERSPVNPEAPTVTKDVRDAFLARPELREQLLRSLKRMLSFYGFKMINPDAGEGTTDGESTTNQTSAGNDSGEGFHICPALNFDLTSKRTWRTSMDHNHLRITRIIRSLRVLGLEDEARRFYRALLENERDCVSSRTLKFWKRAAERPLHLPPQEEDESAEGVAWLRVE